MTNIDKILLIISVLLLACIFLSKVSEKVGVPSLLLFIGIGMLAGSDGPGGIYFDDYYLAQSIGNTALICILFDGGLRTKWSSIRPVFWYGISLSTFGVMTTALLVGICSKMLINFTWGEAFLLGSIVSSTDAAAVFSIMQSRRTKLKGTSSSILELESSSNDPMAIFLTVGILQILNGRADSAITLLTLFIKQMAIGGMVGYVGGKTIIWFINKIKLGFEGLYPVLTLSAILFLYSLTTILEGSGFLAVYIAGLILGNGDFIHKEALIRFHDAIAWMSQITVFLTLGLLVFPSHFNFIALHAGIIGLFLIIIARPLSVLFSLFGSKISFKEKIFISWVGLRGATPIILSTYPLLAGIPNAEVIFNIVFFIVLLSVVFQGPSISWLARRFRLTDQSSPL